MNTIELFPYSKLEVLDSKLEFWYVNQCGLCVRYIIFKRPKLISIKIDWSNNFQLYTITMVFQKIILYLGRKILGFVKFQKFSVGSHLDVRK